MTRFPRSFLSRALIAVFALAGLLVTLYPSSQSLDAREAEVSGLRSRAGGGMLRVGEELQYKVSYSIFNLGKIRVKVVGKEQRGGQTVYRTQAFIDSNPSLPFVNLHIRFESILDEEIYSYTWLSTDSSKDGLKFRNFFFDYDSGRVIIEQGTKPFGGSQKMESRDIIPVSQKCQDGLSLFFYARENVREQKQVNVPTFIEKKQANTFINFAKKRTSEEIDAVDYPIEVLEFNGRADYEGVFGMTGNFEGWFSNDEASIPIIAKMKVILGSIKIQLEKWNRPGWEPPRFVEEKKR